ncbi:V-type ATP synthase subunit F [Candidatus Woesearchaeota archaeon]|nr:V-type ATP synthase subunit F [Candidatus Woesearchaeota archaeon]
MELNVVGGSDFVLGFQLSGIQKTFEVDDRQKCLDTINSVMADPNAGILILDDKIFQSLAPHEKERVERSVKPVVLTLSTSTGQDAMRKMILKSIGVDLWKE